ncbi:carotenoid cleavage dioxygenase 1 [Poronia punctata]|nr:carotenoid cleavage dioxygenase 1 [Poronia punctata]
MSPDINTLGSQGSSIPTHEEKDFQAAVKRRQNVKIEDWPNEAGFESMTEVRGPVELKVSGSIPSWAAGTLYRTGPGQFSVEDTPRGTFKATHWFDGFAHTHRFEIIADSNDANAPVKVEYSSRFQAEEHVRRIKKLGKMPDMSFGQRQDPCVGIFGKMMSVFKKSEVNNEPGTQNISVTVHADMPGYASKREQSSSGHRVKRTLFTSTDASIVQEFDADTLEPIGIARQENLHPDLKGPLSSAHAHRDPESGDLFNYNLDMGRVATYRVFRTSASTGKTDILATISAPDLKPAYIHSFYMSPSFVILCVPSTHIGYMGISVPWNGNVVDAIEPFDKSKLCKWFIVDRRGDGGLVATAETAAGFFFHSVNSFEEVDEETGDINLFCDVIQYPSTDIIRAFEMDVLMGTEDESKTKTSPRSEQLARDCLQYFARHKFTVPAKGNKKNGRKPPKVASEKVLEFKSPHIGELPTINPSYATKPYRYVYSMGTRGYTTLQDSIVKTDLVTRETTAWEVPGHTPGEAIFVARPSEGDTDTELDEDDGVLLSVILDGYGKNSYLVCIDAKTMKELGRADCDWAIGHGFHGLHLPA